MVPARIDGKCKLVLPVGGDCRCEENRIHAWWECEATAEIRSRYPLAAEICKEFTEAADEEHYQAPLIQHGLVPKTTFLQDMEKTRPAQAEISMASWSQADIDAAAGRWSVAPGSHTWRIARHAFTDGSTFSNDCPWSRSGYSVVLQTRDEYDLPDGWYDLNG